MLSRLKHHLLRQSYFFIGYLLFIVSLITTLFFTGKKESSFWINQHWSESQDVFFKYITFLGDGWFAFLVILLLFIFGSKIKWGFYAIAAFLSTAIFTQLLKRSFFSEALRPSLEYYTEFKAGLWHQVEGVDLLGNHSFPSGHATSAFSVFCLLALITNNKKHGLLFLIVAILTAYSRVYLSQHFLEDILVGAIIGGLGGVIIYMLLDQINWSKKLEKGFLNNTIEN